MLPWRLEKTRMRLSMLTTIPHRLLQKACGRFCRAQANQALEMPHVGWLERHVLSAIVRPLSRPVWREFWCRFLGCLLPRFNQEDPLEAKQGIAEPELAYDPAFLFDLVQMQGAVLQVRKNQESAIPREVESDRLVAPLEAIDEGVIIVDVKDKYLTVFRAGQEIALGIIGAATDYVKTARVMVEAHVVWIDPDSQCAHDAIARDIPDVDAGMNHVIDVEKFSSGVDA